MPIYEQTYRSYEGTLRPRFRWITIVQQELLILRGRRMFIFLVLLGNFHFILRVFQVFFLDVWTKNMYGELGQALSELPFEDTGAWVYFDFIRFQGPLLALTLIYAGSGLICNDFRNNLMEIYFSKPLNWRDYVAGKTMTLIFIGLSLSAVPALSLGLMHVLFVPTLAELKTTLALAIPIVGFSFIVVASISLAVLASSALINSSRFASIGVFLVGSVNITFGFLFFGFTQDGNYLALAFPLSLNRLGEIMFDEQRFRVPMDIAWYWPALFVALVCGVSLAIVSRKARIAEVGQ